MERYESPTIKELLEPQYLPPEDVIRSMGICQCPCWCKCGGGSLKKYTENIKKD